MMKALHVSLELDVATTTDEALLSQLLMTHLKVALESERGLLVDWDGANLQLELRARTSGPPRGWADPLVNQQLYHSSTPSS